MPRRSALLSLLFVLTWVLPLTAACQSAQPTPVPAQPTAVGSEPTPVMTSTAIPTSIPVATSTAIPTPIPVATSTTVPEPTPVVTSALGKSGIKPGLYVARLSANPSLGVDGGYYAVRLDADGFYHIIWFGTDRSNLDAGGSGMEGVLGTYQIDSDQISFTDVEGFAACTPEEGVQGTYRFALDGSALRFTRLSDNCGARAHVLATQTMRLDKP